MNRDNRTVSQYAFSVNGEVKTITISSVYCIGYSGRDQEKVQEHIDELAELGIPKPEEVPMLYPVRLNSLNQGELMEVLGKETSGEAEIVLIFGENESDFFISVGSDHTDRDLEAVDINKSKQICDKPLASKAWPYADVKTHWDQLQLKSQVLIAGKWEDYQSQYVTAILPLEEILTYLERKAIPLKNTIIFAGTVPLLDGFKYGEAYQVEIVDPVRKESIYCQYYVKNLERK